MDSIINTKLKFCSLEKNGKKRSILKSFEAKKILKGYFYVTLCFSKLRSSLSN